MYPFLQKPMLQPVIPLCVFCVDMSVFILVFFILPTPIYPIVFRHPGLTVVGKHCEKASPSKSFYNQRHIKIQINQLINCLRRVAFHCQLRFSWAVPQSGNPCEHWLWGWGGGKNNSLRYFEFEQHSEYIEESVLVSQKKLSVKHS